VKSHEDLDVWQKAVELAEHIYRVTYNFPNDEKFGLVSQMRRAAVSIASNIAEGAARQSRKEFVQFLCIASGSTSELLTQIVISDRVGIGDSRELANASQLTERVARMLQGLIKGATA
jgi:four helix bundle protein